MNFTSFHFLAFFFVTITLGHLLKNRSQRVFLLVASYYFYGAFEPRYLVLIFCSTLWDYVAGLGIEKAREKGSFLSVKQWLATSIVLNLSLLGYFKYTNFGIEVYNDLSPLGGTVFAWPVADILLPIGISFYTFQSMSYTIDVYRGVLQARRSFVDFAMYVSFFPQLVAGPIVRATTFLRQLDDPMPVTSRDILVGTTRIVTGFFRKLVLSDNLAPLVNGVFADPLSLHPGDVWLGSFAFGILIYLDFAGYTDIARGLGRLFGYEFELNFLYPFAARNITDHWQRWHLSLTTWIRDYVYIPLGGSRKGVVRTYVNIFTIWLLTGLWHGAAYHFVAWGVWQFVMVATHKAYLGTGIGAYVRGKIGKLYGVLCWAFTMFCLTFGFVWFRALDMTMATIQQGRLFGIYNLDDALGILRDWLFRGGSLENFTAAWSGPANLVFPAMQYSEYAALIALYVGYDFLFNRYQLEYFRKDENKGKLTVMLTLKLLAILVLSSPETPDFMYFQF